MKIGLRIAVFGAVELCLRLRLARFLHLFCQILRFQFKHTCYVTRDAYFVSSVYDSCSSLWRQPAHTILYSDSSSLAASTISASRATHSSREA